MTENTSSTATVDHEEETATAPHAEDGDDSHPLPDSLSVDAPDDLAYAERTYVHEDDDYCAQDTDGRVIVGVTNDAGEVLLLVNDERSHAILPNCHVEAGDWADVARRTVEESTGVAIDLEGPAVVRAVDHRIEGEDENEADGVHERDEENGRKGAHDDRTFHVVFHGTPTEAANDTEPGCDDPDWRTGWYDEIPYEIDSEHGDVLDDIERFLE